MRLTYVGHATVLIEDAGSAILTDPLLRRRVGHLRRQGDLPAPLPNLDGVLISHLHRDHLDTPSLKRLRPGTPAVVPASGAKAVARAGLEPRPIEVGGELALGAFHVRAVHAEHPTRRTPMGPETGALGFVVTSPAGSVYFAGDTDLFDGMREIGAAGLDVALLPVAGWGPTLGPGHLDPHAAAVAAERLVPRIAIPIHWGTISPVGTSDPGDRPAAEFAQHVAQLAPAVRVVQLAPGESFDL